MAKHRGPSRLKKILIVFSFLLLAGAAITIYSFYKMVYEPNIFLEKKKEVFIYIPTGSTFEDVVSILEKEHLLLDRASFYWVAERMNYRQNIHPGKYRILAKMNNKQLLTLLRSGKQVPVKIVIGILRTKDQLVSKIASQLEADSASLVDALGSNTLLKKFGVNRENALALFIPNTYEFNWNTSAEMFLKRLAAEYARFWTEERLLKAKKTGLAPSEVITLASIVEMETSKDSEKSMIAGVYINRLRKNWKLQADPTLIYALGDFSVHRVLDVHKEKESPYNTYKYYGLPPGPICNPSLSSVNAVLDYTRHNYMYFCAKEDFSGYHCFSETYGQHMTNARKFQRELNKRNIH